MWVWPCFLPSSVLPGWTDGCVLYILHPSIFLSLPVVHWDAFQDLLFETRPYCVTLAGPKLMILMILLLQLPKCWDYTMPDSSFRVLSYLFMVCLDGRLVFLRQGLR